MEISGHYTRGLLVTFSGHFWLVLIKNGQISHVGQERPLGACLSGVLVGFGRKLGFSSFSTFAAKGRKSRPLGDIRGFLRNFLIFSF